MKLSVSLFSFWDSPYEFDYLGISDQAHTLCIWHDGRIEAIDVYSGEPIEPVGKDWDFLFGFISRVREYEPDTTIMSGGADVYYWSIEL